MSEDLYEDLDHYEIVSYFNGVRIHHDNLTEQQRGIVVRMATHLIKYLQANEPLGSMCDDEVNRRFLLLYTAIPGIKSPPDSWEIDERRRILAAVKKMTFGVAKVLDTMGLDATDWSQEGITLIRKNMKKIWKQLR